MTERAQAFPPAPSVPPRAVPAGTSPRLVVGDIEICGAQVRIGGEFPGMSPSPQVPPVLQQAQLDRSTPAASAYSQPQASAQALPSQPYPAPTAAGAFSTERGTPLQQEHPLTSAGTTASPAAPPAISTVRQGSTQLERPREPGLFEGTSPTLLLGAGSLGLFLMTTVGPLAGLLADELTVGLLLTATLALGLGWKERRRSPPGPAALDAPQLHQLLVQLADRHRGVLAPTDLVRELGMSFPTAEAQLQHLARQGYAVIEFDPRTQAPVYRIA